MGNRKAGEERESNDAADRGMESLAKSSKRERKTVQEAAKKVCEKGL